ncbi:phiSA1p31-related protein [Streptomyces sp. A3M-1-3]|uniref:phiSA1p31-related protein n=1 Tax=Streptomyces sp. A3M-1-3 TaxID=2962044 RepID=UPI0020B803DE|nr:phiSA1p31-related protein [Streptomyces sp. A3M-1-3]MCP3817794.1 phiSA1p31-related protein [Streptomyces sp. A3M-1-3]
MTGPEHYREAERLVTGSKTRHGALIVEEGTAEVLAAAQVHATLALTAATAMQAAVDGSEPGMAPYEFDAWYKAAGVKVPMRSPAEADPIVYGRLDPDRKTWTHDNGTVMDLSHGWKDCEGRHWHWDSDAAPDPVNGPWMRAAAYGLREPLDLVLTAWGPIKALPRFCAECNETFAQGAGVGAYCSPRCRNAADRHDTPDGGAGDE